MANGRTRWLHKLFGRWRKRWFSAANWSEIGKFRRELEAEKYDLVIDCQGLIKTAWVASWARGPNGNERRSSGLLALASAFSRSARPS